MALKLYVLFSSSRIRVEDPDDGSECRGVYSSEDELRKGVDQWIGAGSDGEIDDHILFYQEWVVDEPTGPYSWEWCYIPITSERKRLEMGGAYAPTVQFWGHNLVGKTFDYYKQIDP